MKKTIPVKPYSHGELTALYGVSPRTLKHWLEPYQQEIGRKIGRYYCTRQVEVIFRSIGPPVARWITDE